MTKPHRIHLHLLIVLKLAHAHLESLVGLLACFRIVFLLQIDGRDSALGRCVR